MLVVLFVVTGVGVLLVEILQHHLNKYSPSRHSQLSPSLAERSGDQSWRGRRPRRILDSKYSTASGQPSTAAGETRGDKQTLHYSSVTTTVTPH